MENRIMRCDSGPDADGGEHPGVDLDRLRRRLGDLAGLASRGADPGGGDAAAAATTETDRAIAYSINQYRQRQGKAFSLAGLAADLDTIARDATYKVDGFRAMVREATFESAYQPIVDLATGAPIHYEALVRFGANRFDVSPYEFITFAEAIGLIHEFDLAMCAKVLALLSARDARGLSSPVAVNLSAESLTSQSFAGSLAVLLRSHSAVRGRLMFEITETANISDLEGVNDFIQDLRRAGHKVCLDDFGAGAAAFRYLRALEVDVVKIDGGYVKNAYATPKGRKFLKAMAGLLRELGIVTIAEMVEDEKHLPIIRDSGIMYGQGYLFGRPSIDIEVFEHAPAAA